MPKPLDQGSRALLGPQQSTRFGAGEGQRASAVKGYFVMDGKSAEVTEVQLNSVKYNHVGEIMISLMSYSGGARMRVDIASARIH